MSTKGFSLLVSIKGLFRGLLLSGMDAQTSGRVRVLVVDDEEMIRRVLSDILEGAGLEVVTAGSGEEALRIFDGGDFSLTLTDWHMPGVGGGELACRIKGQVSGHLVLMVSGMVPEADSWGATCVDGHLKKPFSRASVLEGVGKALGWAS